MKKQATHLEGLGLFKSHLSALLCPYQRGLVMSVGAYPCPFGQYSVELLVSSFSVEIRESEALKPRVLQGPRPCLPYVAAVQTAVSFGMLCRNTTA